MDGLTGKNRSEPLEIVQKELDSRDNKEDPLSKKMELATMAALQAPSTFNSAHAPHDKKRKPLQKRSMCLLQKMGHWENECPWWEHVGPQTQANPSYGGLARPRLLWSMPPGAYSNLHHSYRQTCKFSGRYGGYPSGIMGILRTTYQSNNGSIGLTGNIKEYKWTTDWTVNLRTRNYCFYC